MPITQKDTQSESISEKKYLLNDISSKNGTVRLVFIVKICVAAALIWLLVDRLDYTELAAAFHTIDWRFFTAAVLLMPVNLFGQIFKWHFLLKQIKRQVTWRECGLSLLAGLTLGFVTPGRLGEFGRAFFVENVKRSHVAGLVLIEKFVSALLISFCGTWSLYFMAHLGYFTEGEELWFSAAILISVVILGLLLFSGKVLDFVISGYQYLVRKGKLSPRSESAVQIIDPSRITRYFGYDFLYYIIVVSQFYLFLRAFEFFPVTLGYILVFAIIAAKSVLPISLGDLGVREAAAIYFVIQVGGQETSAFNAAILIFLINLAVPALVGLLVLLRRRPNLLFSKYTQKKAVQI